MLALCGCFQHCCRRALAQLPVAPICRLGACLLLAGLLAGCGMSPPAQVGTRDNVGCVGPNRYYTPANQVLAPAGLQIEMLGMRPQALALSPDGRFLATAGKTHELVVLEPGSGRVLQRVPLPSEKDRDPTPNPVSDHILQPDKDGQISFTGLAFSPDGKRIYLANVDGSIKVFGEQGGKVEGLFTMPLPQAAAPRREAEIPAGLAISRDGKRLYVALNLSNRLAELDALTGKVLRLWEVGVAPYDVVLAGHKAYVSNWGGRRPDADSVTGPAGRGTLVRVAPVPTPQGTDDDELAVFTDMPHPPRRLGFTPGVWASASNRVLEGRGMAPILNFRQVPVLPVTGVKLVIPQIHALIMWQRVFASFAEGQMYDSSLLI